MDKRRDILLAARDEIAEAGVEELFAFLTPARLADGDGRQWSEGTVRYHFRSGAPGFARGRLIAEVTAYVTHRIGRRLGRWASATERALAGERDPFEVLAGAFDMIAERVDDAEVRVARILMLADAEARAQLEAIVADAVGRVLDAYARAASAAAPSDEMLEELASVVASRVVVGEFRAGRLAAIARAVLQPRGDEDAPREVADPEGVEDAVLRLERELEAVALSSAQAVGSVERLALLSPTGEWAFARVRSRMERLLTAPDLRTTMTGRRVWIAAAETVAMASGDRALGEEAATLALEVQPLRAEPVSLQTAIRTAWLLIRLDRLEEARDQLERARRLAARARIDDVRALADAFAALTATLAGPLDDVFRLTAASGSPSQPGIRALANSLAAATTGRALLLRGQNDAAADVLLDPQSNALPTSLGTTMMEIYSGWLLLAGNQDAEAHATLTRVRERLARVAAHNPAGWPWLEPSVAALVRIGQHDEATELIAAAEPIAEQWGTPLVLAEVQRARALAATTDAERRTALRKAHALLSPAGPAVELERAAVTLELLETGDAKAGRTATGLSPGSVLVRAHVPRGGALAGMSPRVREVALLAAAGVSNEEIAARLSLATSTVARHVSTALRATGTRNRTELAALLARYTT